MYRRRSLPSPPICKHSCCNGIKSCSSTHPFLSLTYPRIPWLMNISCNSFWMRTSSPHTFVIKRRSIALIQLQRLPISRPHSFQTCNQLRINSRMCKIIIPTNRIDIKFITSINTMFFLLLHPHKFP